MKRLLAWTLTILIVISLLPNAVLALPQKKGTVFAGGDGSKDNPYLVSTPQQLDAVRQDLSAHYLQINDIDMSEWKNWVPIGSASSLEDYWDYEPGETTPFTGSYDGGNFAITGLRIFDDDASIDADCIGLFGGAEQAELINIHLKKASISVDRELDDYEMMYENCGYATLRVGGICANGDNTKIDNCSFSGEILVSNACTTYAGGIVGYGNYVTITGCANSARINVCANQPYSRSTWSRKGSDALVGGIIGKADSCQISRCVNTESLYAMAAQLGKIGGICGYLERMGGITNCANYGPVRADVDVTADYVETYGTYAGGIVGEFSFGSTDYEYGAEYYFYLESCVNYGTVYAQTKGKKGGRMCVAYAGGIAGFGHGQTGERVYASICGLVNAAATIHSATVNSDNEIEFLDDCARICPHEDYDLYYRFCVSLADTLRNGVQFEGNETADGFLDEPERAVSCGKLTAAQLLEQSSYSWWDHSFNFVDIWQIDPEAGGAVLQGMPQAKRISVKVSHRFLRNVATEDPRKGAFRYEITAVVKNATGEDVSDFVLTLELGEGLSLVEGSELQVSLGDLRSEQEVKINWIADAPWPEERTDLRFLILATGGEDLHLTREGTIFATPPTYTDTYGWPLLNYRRSFGYSDPYRIPLSRYYETFGVNLISQFYSPLDNILPWNGNCFAMSLLTLAQYYGVLDLSAFFDQEGDYLHDFGYSGIYANKSGEQCFTVEGNQDFIDLLERVQISQGSKEFDEFEVFKNDPDYSELLRFMSSNTARPLLVSTPNHAMVITTDSPPVAMTDEAEGWYLLPLYDPNAPTNNGGLTNPMSYYDHGESYLAVNPETSEWSYYYKGKWKGTTYYDMSAGSLVSLHFYDVSQMDASFFVAPLNLLYYRTQFRIYGLNAIIKDANGYVMFSMEEGKLKEVSSDFVIKTYKNAGEDGAAEYAIYTNLTDLTISSEDALVTVLHGETVNLLELNDTFTVSINSETGEVVVNSVTSEGEFVICTQDWDAHGVRITGKNVKDNHVTIRQSGTAVEVKTQKAKAEITYECENIGAENVTVIREKKDAEDKKDSVDDEMTSQPPSELPVAMLIVAAVAVAIVAVVVILLVRKNKGKKDLHEDA